MNLIKSTKAAGSDIKSKLDHSYVKAQKAKRDIGYLYNPDPIKAQRARNKLKTQGRELAESSSNIIAKAAGELAGALVPIPVISQFTNSTAENLARRAFGQQTENTDLKASATEEFIEDAISGTLGEIAGDITEAMLPVPVVNKALNRIVNKYTDKFTGYAIDRYQNSYLATA